VRRSISSLVLVVGVLPVGPAVAEVVKLSFTGTYDTEGDTVFGLSGAAVPYHYEITYDTSLDTNTHFFASGESVPAFNIGSAVTTHPIYGYSASGILSSKLLLGVKEWTKDSLASIVIGANFTSAELWFDTDISVATPTKAAITLGSTGSGGRLHLGRGVIDHDTATIFLRQDSTATHYDSQGDEVGSGHSSLMTIERILVPEPNALSLMILGMTLVAKRRRSAGR